MTISNAVRERIRQRANFACEYCGVTETDVGGSLTIDHFQPRSQGGTDDFGNLVYCCHLCNEYKSSYWPQSSAAPTLWNPRVETADAHFAEALDGALHASTAIGRFTLQRLRLNRSALVAHRLQKRAGREQEYLFTRYRELHRVQERLRQEEAMSIEDERLILEEQHRIVRMLLGLDRPDETGG